MPEQDRQALATEVLELGEQLFALALEGRASQQAGEEDGEQNFPIVEIEAASRILYPPLRVKEGKKKRAEGSPYGKVG